MSDWFLGANSLTRIYFVLTRSFVATWARTQSHYPRQNHMTSNDGNETNSQCQAYYLPIYQCLSNFVTLPDPSVSHVFRVVQASTTFHTYSYLSQKMSRSFQVTSNTMQKTYMYVSPEHIHQVFLNTTRALYLYRCPTLRIYVLSIIYYTSQTILLGFLSTLIYQMRNKFYQYYVITGRIQLHATKIKQSVD